MARKLPELVGKVFGRLKVVSLADRSKYGFYLWRCQCDCGTEISCRGSDLVGNKTRSCGCLRRETAARTKRTHGDTRPSRRPGSAYISWSAAKARCLNPKTPGYHNYGGRGIEMCSRWLSSYETFLEDMGPRPPGTSIDRVDPNGNYEPGNCRWADAKTQRLNRRPRKTRKAA